MYIKTVKISYTMILILMQVIWVKAPIYMYDIIRKQLNYQFHPNIDKTRNVYQKFINLLYNYTHLKAGSLRSKPLFMHRHSS